MRIVSWNVNGLRSVLQKSYYDFLESYDPDVFCLQETKIGPQTALPDLGPFPYRYLHCAGRPGYSGTAVLSKIPPRSYDCGTAPDGLLEPREGRVQLLDFGALFLLNVYVPNARADLSRLPLRRDRWDPTFLALLRELGSEKFVLACGDFNVAHEPIDLARPDENRGHAGFTDEERAGFGAYLSAGFVDVFRSLHPRQAGAYSWWSYRAGARKRNVGWRIDYFLASPELAGSAARCEILTETGGSDHGPILLDLRI
ncbi:MAG: exodeoxyribonuclease III [Puniceicoccales bacterium]|jgi:exodeoxyribonuclease-3|nr:exodeoxyribonuclease III [Puniceicoccales bacterium]